MNIYLVKRNDEVWYDETAGMVIVAKTEEDAIQFFLDDVNGMGEYRFEESKMTADKLFCIHIGRTVPTYAYNIAHVVLTDFRAG